MDYTDLSNKNEARKIERVYKLNIVLSFFVCKKPSLPHIKVD